MSKKVKQLYGKPVEDLKVQEMVKEYIEESFSFLSEDLIQKLANTSVGELDMQELENMIPSPFAEDEQKWLNESDGILYEASRNGRGIDFMNV